MSWHRHVWKVVEKQVFPSTLDKMLKRTDLTHFTGATDIVPVLVTYRCEKCGTEKVELL